MKKIAVIIIFIILSALSAGAEETAIPADNASTVAISWNKGGGTVIDADKLDYDGAKKIYYLTGNVEISSKKDNSTVTADYAEFYEDSSLAVLKGNVIYEDNDVRALAEEAELYTDNNTGFLTRARLLFKKDNYHVRGETIQKLNSDNYYVEKGSITTCDAPVPAWCFYADETSIQLNEEVVSKNVTMRVNDVPLLYSPIFSQALRRKTGFLMPVVGYNSFKGTFVSVPFFWAISENRDMTIVPEYYSKRGEGQGIEYRYIEKGGIEGRWWLYHLRDRKDDKNYFQIVGKHNHITESGFSTMLDVNYLNQKDYYQLYSPSVQKSISRYIESTGEVAYSTEKIRTYLLSQYWVDLQNSNGYVSQRVPELGFTVHPIEITPVDAFSMRSAMTNFISEHSIKGERFDIYPKVYWSIGDGIRFTQTLGARETFYKLSQTVDGRNTINNFAGVYNASLDATLVKDYSSFTHIFEPSVRFNYISNDIYTDNDTYPAPILDSTELFKKTASTELALMNYLRNNNGTFLFVNLVNSYDALDTSYRLQPMKLQLTFKKPFTLKAEAYYDFKTGTITKVNSTVSLKLSDQVTFSLGERYNVPNNITYLTGTFDFVLSKEYALRTNTWYDARIGEAKYYSLDLFYKQQCWGLNFRVARTPDSFGVYMLLDLKGIGTQQLFTFGNTGG
ncbi:LPS-assembly protein LptD [Candidatus Magnetominusculus xianensis]|uniref:Organic solvent tolerance protein n=1 Tax=Candidatus Magnetominusculus xianensis TaxID=1748249 RepID=A0ABR5SGJ5_9BACT|nr:LPS assembly protein LptD [Candidatus Magnetominusculus xianensis]KWT90129.1 organic solvent tolerance protein [Candidatus Magnetominusculus xianensis]MBF0403623.1 LPS-assembly protein LptD [Nitrospirota bacterium]